MRPQSENTDSTLAQIADEKRLEAVLRATDAFHKQLLENLPIGVYTCDADGLITFYTRRAAEMWGREPVLGDPAEKFCGSFKIFDLDGNFIPNSQCPMAMTILDGKPRTNHEIVIERPDGTKVVTLVNPAPILDDQGNLIGAVNCFIDVTEKKQTERAAEEYRLRLEAMFDHSSDAILIVDDEARFISVNPAACKWLAYSQQEFLTMRIADLFPVNQRYTFSELWKEFVSDGQMKGEVRLKRKDGTLVEGDLEAVANFVPGLHMYFVRDVTERNRAAAEIRGEHQLKALVLDTAPVGMLIVDKSGAILLANRELYRILDQPVDSLRTLDDYLRAAVALRPDGSPYEGEERPIWRTFRKAERIKAEEVIYQLTDGRKVPALANKTPVVSETGETLMVILAIQDMSAVEESQRARSEFLGVVSHEMRNPISIIKGAASTARASHGLISAEDTWEMFEIIEEQTDRLRDLVDNLLDINRIESGMLSISLELVDLASVLEDAKSSYERGGGRHMVVIRMPDGGALVKADRSRLVQVLTNLLSNASKFSPPPQPIEVAVEVNDTQVTVNVRDKGIGISRDRLPLLFRKFTRLHAGDAGTPSGTGLGLAICKGLVEAHGGRIWADSPGEGLGATFSFSLPVATRLEGQAVVRGDQDAHMRPDNGRSQRFRVLAVDDEARVLTILRRSLTAAGYEVITTPDPAEAITLVRAEVPDLLLLDIRMPGISGLDLLEEIREFSQVPAIFLTASDDDGDRLRAIQLRASDYISKPFSNDEIISRLDSALSRRVALR